MQALSVHFQTTKTKQRKQYLIVTKEKKTIYQQAKGLKQLYSIVNNKGNRTNICILESNHLGNNQAQPQNTNLTWQQKLF